MLLSDELQNIYIRAKNAMPSIFGQHQPCRKFRVITASMIFSFVSIVSGCSLPPYLTSLDDILHKEGIFKRKRYGYRCTAGAHRGASEEHKENTRTALMAAEENSKYAFIEFDVQFSKDSRIVVFHDKRMLRLYGSLGTIGSQTFAELYKITDGEITAYDEVIGRLKKKLNIEIKSQGDIEEDKRLADEIIADIRARNRDKDVLLSSISGDIIKYVNQNYPDIPTGQVFWLTSSTFLHIESLTKRLYEEINATQADYLMLHVANLHNIEDLLNFKPRGKTIVFWDFDDTMYIVHKDLSDRLWGNSGIKTFLNFLHYRLVSVFRRANMKGEKALHLNY
jgi:glycerophosphoryl diester phosphodiesterase